MDKSQKNLIAHLSCSLCKKPLSVPPIYIVSNKSICGRCKCTSARTRNHAYEEIAKTMTFPCIYNGCKQRLSWGCVTDHEKYCLHKNIMCPFESCETLCEKIMLKSHYTKCHKEFICRDEICVPGRRLQELQSSGKVVYLLVNEGKSYLVHVGYSYERKKSCIELQHTLGVFSLQDEGDAVRYNVFVVFAQDEKMTTTVFRRDQEVKAFGDHASNAVTRFESLHKQWDTTTMSIRIKVYTPEVQTEIKKLKRDRSS